MRSLVLSLILALSAVFLAAPVSAGPSPTSWEPAWSSATTLICADQVATQGPDGTLCCGDARGCAEALRDPHGELPTARLAWPGGGWICTGEAVYHADDTLCCGDAAVCAAAANGGPVPAGRLLEVLTLPGARPGLEPIDAALCGGEVKVQCCGHECCGSADACARWCKAMCALPTEGEDPGVDRCVPMPYVPEDEAEL